jgi:hypothetical protein
MTMECHIDNITVIKKIMNRRNNKRTVNQYHDPDVDLELQVLEEINTLDAKLIKVIISYIQSYRINTKKKDLTRMAKMHCIADGLVKQASVLPRVQTLHKQHQTHTTASSLVSIQAQYTVGRHG